jgi:hypothetical protein
MTPGVIECKRPDGTWQVVARIDADFYGGVRMRLDTAPPEASAEPAIAATQPHEANGHFDGTFALPADRGVAGHAGPPPGKGEPG